MERQGKTYWMRIGSAYTNVDGSTNVYLDAFPANGKLQIREFNERDEQKKDSSANPSSPLLCTNNSNNQNI